MAEKRASRRTKSPGFFGHTPRRAKTPFRVGLYSAFTPARAPALPSWAQPDEVKPMARTNPDNVASDFFMGVNSPVDIGNYWLDSDATDRQTYGAGNAFLIDD
jgi:hypothetical protein